MMEHGARDHWLAEHARVASGLPGDGWLRRERADALARFAESGLPGVREESWKYTDLRGLAKQRFTTGQPLALDAAAMRGFLPAGLDAHRLVFVNGQYAPALSDIGTLPRGVSLGPLSAMLPHPDDGLRSQLNATVNGSRTALTDLNTAFLSDGLYLQLADGTALERPLHLLFIASGSGGMSHLRNLIRLGRGSEAKVIEHYVGTDDVQGLTTAITEVQAGPGARLLRSKLQQASAGSFHIGGFYLDQARDSHALLHAVDLGGRLVRNDTHSRLAGTGAEVQLHGIYAPTGRQHMDNHTQIDHLQPQGTSRETYRGVLDGHGRGVFNGKIVVHKDAQKTDSAQSSAALLLSKTAEVDAKPELEIYADDVKCAHGATVGQLDENAVFYLQSRGVDEAGARSILTYSFADEVIRRLDIQALRRHIESHFLSRLPNGDSLRDLL
jgi:Fe-S cluster assembly protein SufD